MKKSENSISDYEIGLIYKVFYRISSISELDFNMSMLYWKKEEFKKNTFFNEKGAICKKVSIIINGSFRAYKITKQGEERNLFLFCPNNVLVAYKSFLNQEPCDYYTQATSDSIIFSISEESLLFLYNQSKEWEHFGRKLAELAYIITEERLSYFSIYTPKERLIMLIKSYPIFFDYFSQKHIASYLGIEAQSLSRIKKNINMLT